MSTFGSTTTPPEAAAPTRKVSILLGIGIFLLPIVFAWFTLRKGYSVTARVISFVWLAIIVVTWIGGHSGKVDPNAYKSAATPTASTTTADTDAAKPDSAPESKWTYSESKDEMRGTTSKSASIMASNELEFGFPYQGGSTATLTFFQHGKGIEDNLRIDKGQFLCHSFTNSHVAVKLDNGPVVNYRCEDTSDGDTTVTLLEPASKLFAGVRHAKKMMVEAEFYQEGRQQMVFDVSGLKWGGK